MKSLVERKTDKFCVDFESKSKEVLRLMSQIPVSRLNCTRQDFVVHGYKVCVSLAVEAVPMN